MRTTEALSFTFPPKTVKEISDVAKKEGKTKSQLIRDALEQYLSERRWRQLQKELTARARALGIYTEKDVERIVDEVREKEDKK